ncbi:MAG TPA: Kdo hydroxylase family protein [Bryobacteraceae bacterium]|nr:Kdo hydroxylase family protein [Bryobacteraceae bacterium]
METLVELTDWPPPTPASKPMAALEEGSILFAPRVAFELTDAERRFLSPACLSGKSKNISLNTQTGVLHGTGATGAERDELQQMLRRFSDWARDTILALCPGYRDSLRLGLASFRPAEIAGRSSSWRKDDTRLHVDAFPSRPMQGRRILRLFANVGGAARLWRAGEPFEQVARTFLPRLRPPAPGSSWLLRFLHVTRERRTPYDHFMLGIHDAMKADQSYQSSVSQTEIAFPPGSTWACYTDAVSHAAMSGQFAFEQTFYLPVNAMQDPARAPLRILERLLGRTLA